MRKLMPIVALAAIGALTACSPEQEAAWLRWWHTDPQAAADWAVNECGELCTEDTNHNGVVEPDANSSSDSTSDQSDGDVIDDQYPNLGGSCSEWSDDALAVGWSADQWSTLSYIMYRESRCNPGAYNGSSGASGLLQIMPMWADDCGGGSLFDPWFNLRCGLHILAAQGWGAWSTY